MSVRDLMVLLASAGLGAYLFVGSGCTGVECDCGTQTAATLDAGAYEVIGGSADATELEGASVAISDQGVIVTYEAEGALVSVEYAIAGTYEDYL